MQAPQPTVNRKGDIFHHEVMTYPPYSPNLVLSAYHYISEKRINTEDGVQKNLDVLFIILIDFYRVGH